MTKGSAGSVGMSAARLERIGLVMQQSYVDRGIYAGVSTIVARRGIVVHEGNCGFRDREADLPMTEDTIFRLFHDEAHRLHSADDFVRGGAFRLIVPVAR